MWRDKEGMFYDDDFTLAVVAILVQRLVDAQVGKGLEPVVRLTQEDFDNIAHRTLLEGQDIDTHDVLLKIVNNRELS